MPNDQKEMGLVDWVQVRTFTDLLHHNDSLGTDEKPHNPIFALFPTAKGPCIHAKGWRVASHNKETIEPHLQRNKDLSLGLIVGVHKPKPEDWGKLPDHKNKSGKIKTWGATDDHIKEVWGIFAEGDSGKLDFDSQCEQVRNTGLHPSVEIFTGNKSGHFYFLTSEPIEPDKFRELQKRLAQFLNDKCPDLGIDKGIHNPARVMRVPGGLHAKTRKRCEIKTIRTNRYSIEELDNLLPPLVHKKVEQKKIKTFSEKGREKYLTKPAETAPAEIQTEGWFSDMPAEFQHQTAVEMLKFVPRREQLGKGERQGICIPVLFGLVNHFGETEATRIIEEASWTSENWNPLHEMQYVHNPNNEIGCLIHHARANGWTYEEKKPEKSSAISLEDVFPMQLVNHLRTVTKHHSYSDEVIAITYLIGVAPLLKLGASIMTNPLTDFEVPLTMFACCVGKSGVKKSPLQKILIEHPVKRVIKKQMEENYKNGLQYAKDCKAYSKDKEKFIDENGMPPEKPPYPILIVQDSTPEALQEQLIQNEKSKKALLRLNDELAGLFNSFGRYTKGKGNEEQQLLEQYDGKGFTTLRKERTLVCNQTAISVFGAIQPEVLAKMMKGKDDNGKWARFCFYQLEFDLTPLPTTATKEEILQHHNAKDHLQYFAQKIFEYNTIYLKLSPEAMARFAEYELDRRKDSHKTKRSSCAAIYNKSAGKVARMSGLLHIISQINLETNTAEVSLDTLEAAIKLIDATDSFAVDFQNDSSLNDKDRLLKNIHNIARKSKAPVPYRDIYNALSLKVRLANNQESILEMFSKLQEMELGKISKGSRGGICYQAVKDFPKR